MNTLLDSLTGKEKDLFKQLVADYDDKKFKASLKNLKKLQEINPTFTGELTRVLRHEGPPQLPHERRVRLRR